MSKCISDNILLGRCLAQLEERASHVQRLCPCCSGAGFESRPETPCCVTLPPSLILFPVMFPAVLSIKAKGQKKDNILLQIYLKWPMCSNSQQTLLLLCIKELINPFFTFWTGSRCGQVKVRGGFQEGTLLVLVFFTLSESSISRKEHRPPQSTRPSSFTASMSRSRPRCSWVMTTLSNNRP